jgi:hypothetical protein
VLYSTCKTLFFSGFLTWLKMYLRSCTLYYNLQVPTKRWKCHFSVPKLKNKFRVAYLQTFLIWSPHPPPIFWDGLTPLDRSISSIIGFLYKDLFSSFKSIRRANLKCLIDEGNCEDHFLVRRRLRGNRNQKTHEYYRNRRFISKV